MAIALRGTAKSAAPINGADATLTFDSAPNNPQAGDIIIVVGGGFNRTGWTPGPTSGQGYTSVISHTDALPFSYVGYKVSDGTETQVVCAGSGNTSDACAYAAIVLSGVNATIFDQTTTQNGPTASTNPNPPAIVTQTANALVLSLAVSTSNDSAPGTQTNYTQDAANGGNDANDASVAISHRTIASPTSEDPPAWSAWTTGTWRGFAVALKPQVPVTVSPGVGAGLLAGLAAVVAVTANVMAAPGVGALTATGLGPAVAVTANQTINPGSGQGALAGFVPTPAIGLNLAPGAGQATLAGIAPVINVSDHQVVTPALGQAVLLGFGPVVTAPREVAAGLGSLGFAGFSPVVAAPRVLTIGLGLLDLAGSAPTVTIGSGTELIPSLGQATWTGFAPTATVPGLDLFPGIGAVTALSFAPTLSLWNGHIAPFGTLNLTGAGR